MKEILKLVKIDSDYCDYLRKFDSKITYNSKVKEQRPFIGVLFIVNDCKYFAPLTSPKPKHLKMRNTIDFLRLDNGRLGAINFNNMIPVMDNNYEIIDLSKNNKYNKLLNKQIYWLNRNKEELYNSSRKLYDKYINDTLPKNIKDRCCNFKLLEEKCALYDNVKVVS